ncbi:MAG: hypothetical protein WKG32_24065 [Gemmatimonadaceae bacterium]
MFTSIAPRRRRTLARALALGAVLAALQLGASALGAQDTARARTRADTARRGDSAGAAKRPVRKVTSAKRKTGTASSAAAAKPPATPKPTPVWPVPGPAPLPGSILPARRVVAFYGNPLSKRMGILGELAPDRMLAKLDGEVAAWNRADPGTPAQPALHLIAVVAQAGAGRDGKYRAKMADSLIERVAGWAASKNALLFLDVQVGKSTLKEELPKLEAFLQRPNVHLGIDPEFSMKTGHKPGTRIGSFDAADVNYAAEYLAGLVTQHGLPPKMLVVHRFTRSMLTRSKQIRLDPRVQIVIHMDGWGPPTLKLGSYERFVYEEPVQFTGFKLFYKNDTKRGHPLMSPADLLKLNPVPVYIQYQ